MDCNFIGAKRHNLQVFLYFSTHSKSEVGRSFLFDWNCINGRNKIALETVIVGMMVCLCPRQKQRGPVHTDDVLCFSNHCYHV